MPLKAYKAIICLALALCLCATATAVPNPNAIQWTAAADEFVSSLFLGVYDRAGTPAEIAAFIPEVTENPNSRLALFNRFVASPEGRRMNTGPKKFTIYYQTRGDRQYWNFSSSPNTDASRIRHSGDFSFGHAKALVRYRQTFWGRRTSGVATLSPESEVDVSTVSAVKLIGKYQLSNPDYTLDRYRGEAHLFAGGHGRCIEYIDNKPGKLNYPESRGPDGLIPVSWSFREGVFTFDYTANGRYPKNGLFRGSVTGTTTRFTLKGRWSSGQAGTLILTRL